MTFKTCYRYSIILVVYVSILTSLLRLALEIDQKTWLRASGYICS